MELPEFAEERDAFKRKLEDFLSEHMPPDWMIAVSITIPEPRADTTIDHIWSFSNIPNKERLLMIVGTWYVNLHEELENRS